MKSAVINENISASATKRPSMDILLSAEFQIETSGGEFYWQNKMPMDTEELHWVSTSTRFREPYDSGDNCHLDCHCRACKDYWVHFLLYSWSLDNASICLAGQI